MLSQQLLPAGCVKAVKPPVWGPTCSQQDLSAEEELCHHPVISEALGCVRGGKSQTLPFILCRMHLQVFSTCLPHKKCSNALTFSFFIYLMTAYLSAYDEWNRSSLNGAAHITTIPPPCLTLKRPITGSCTYSSLSVHQTFHKSVTIFHPGVQHVLK